MIDDPSELSAASATSPPPIPTSKKAGWWAWPLILLCLIPLEKFIDFDRLPKLAQTKREVATAPLFNDSAALALFKVQAQVVIGTAKLDPESAKGTLDELTSMATGDRCHLAMALVESFLDPNPDRALAPLEKLSRQAPKELSNLVRKAVTEGLDETEREKLRPALAWFANLARGPHMALPSNEEAIRTKALVTTGVIGMLGMLAILGVLVGGVLLIHHLRSWKNGSRQHAFVSWDLHRGLLLESFALYLGIMVFGAYFGFSIGGPMGAIAAGAAVILPLLWLRLRGMRWAHFRQAVGFHRGKGILREIGAGISGYLMVLAIASIGIGLTLVLTLVGGALLGEGGSGGGGEVGPEIHPIVGWIYEGGFRERLIALALAAGFAPLTEELFFRGTFYQYLRGRYRFLGAALISSLIFAALHPQGFYGIPALAGIGVGFSLLREWRGSLIAPMTAHAINNGFLVLALWWTL